MNSNSQGSIEAAPTRSPDDGLTGQSPHCSRFQLAAKNAGLSGELEALPGMDIEGLRLRYRQLHRKTAPAHLPRWLLLRIVAYRAQALALGDLHPETIRILERVARDQARAKAAENKDGIAGGAKRSRAAALANSVAAVPDRLRPGTQLVREHGGELHRVIVLENGFSWNGSVFTSLSEIARTITGTSWNGPAFFGLRSRKVLSGLAGADVPVASGTSP